jgi:hypothetical protein
MFSLESMAWKLYGSSRDRLTFFSFKSRIHIFKKNLLLSGAGFSTEPSHHSWPRGKNRFSLGKCASIRKENSSVLRTPLEQPHFTSLELAVRSSRTTLEQFSPRKILLLIKIQGYSAPGRVQVLKISWEVEYNVLYSSVGTEGLKYRCWERVSEPFTKKSIVCSGWSRLNHGFSPLWNVFMNRTIGGKGRVYRGKILRPPGGTV